MTHFTHAWQKLYMLGWVSWLNHQNFDHIEIPIDPDRDWLFGWASAVVAERSLG